MNRKQKEKIGNWGKKKGIDAWYKELDSVEMYKRPPTAVLKKKLNKDTISLAIVGLGPVGVSFITAAVPTKFKIFGYDYSLERVLFLKNVIEGKEVLKEDIKAGKILARRGSDIVLSTEYDDVLKAADIKVICVGTDQIYDAIKALAPYIKQGDIVIIESTLFLHMIESVRDTFTEVGIDPKYDIKLALVPERIMEGKYAAHFTGITKTIGVLLDENYTEVSAVYRTLSCSCSGPHSFEWVTALKTFENAMRFTFISLANEFADIAKMEELDFTSLTNALQNIRPDMPIMRSGIGIGGACIPMAAMEIATQYEETALITMSAVHREIRRKKEFANGIMDILRKEKIDPDKVAVFGATYRRNGTDKRESPAIDIIKHLKDGGYNATIYDYNWKIVDCEPYTVLNNDLDDLIDDYEALIVLVSHSAYENSLFPKAKIMINLAGPKIRAHPDTKLYKLYR